MFEKKGALLYFWLPTRTSCRNLAIFCKFFKNILEFWGPENPKQHSFLCSLKRKIANLGLRPHGVALAQGCQVEHLLVCRYVFSSFKCMFGSCLSKESVDLLHARVVS
jgi:hypothetical protein